MRTRRKYKSAESVRQHCRDAIAAEDNINLGKTWRKQKRFWQLVSLKYVKVE